MELCAWLRDPPPGIQPQSLHGPTKGSAQEHSIYPSIIPGMGGGGILRAHPGRMSSQKPTMEY